MPVWSKTPTAKWPVVGREGGEGEGGGRKEHIKGGDLTIFLVNRFSCAMQEREG